MNKNNLTIPMKDLKSSEHKVTIKKKLIIDINFIN
jgi:hypothetical protein